MIFKRREKRSTWDGLRDALAPRKGWRRGFRYIGKRVQRLPDTPHRIALGFACGAFASFTPFFTLHLFVAAFIAWVIRANVIAGAFGTIVGNPITFPLIATVSYGTGTWLLGRTGGPESLDEYLTLSYVWNNPVDFLDLIFTPYLVGGIAPGVICAIACYYLLRPVVATFQNRRREMLSARARELLSQGGRARSRGWSEPSALQPATVDMRRADPQRRVG